MSEPKYYFHVKTLAAAIDRSPRFVSDMLRGGFEIPATIEDAVIFIRKHPFPSRFRSKSPRVLQSR
jgi:hypothetical protein